MVVFTDSRSNGLLAALPLVDWQRLQPWLELVDLPLGRVLHEPGRALSHVYFPTTAIVSKLSVLKDGATAEFAVVGHEGVVGLPLLAGGESTSSHAVVLVAGAAYRLNAQILQDEFTHSGPVVRRLLRYAQALMTQVAQTAVCNRHHAMSQRLCRLVLMTLDRRRDGDLAMTQQSIADRLGVRREGVTACAHQLQHEGIIDYARGHIAVLDRPALEARACECYQVIRTEYERLLPGPAHLDWRAASHEDPTCTVAGAGDRPHPTRPPAVAPSLACSPA